MTGTLGRRNNTSNRQDDGPSRAKSCPLNIYLVSIACEGNQRKGYQSHLLL